MTTSLFLNETEGKTIKVLGERKGIWGLGRERRFEIGTRKK